MMHSYASARDSKKSAQNAFGYRPGQSSLLGGRYSGSMATRRVSGYRARETSDLYLRILNEAQDPIVPLPVTDQSTQRKCSLYKSNASEVEHPQLAIVPQKRSYCTLSPSAPYQHYTKISFDRPFSLAKRACSQSTSNISLYDSGAIVPAKTMKLAQATRALRGKAFDLCADTANHNSAVRAAMVRQKQHTLDQAPQIDRFIHILDHNANFCLILDWMDDPFIDKTTRAVGPVGTSHKDITAKMSNLSYDALTKPRISKGPDSFEKMKNADKNSKNTYERMTKPAKAPTKVPTPEEAAKNRRLMRTLMRHEMTREERTVQYRPRITCNQSIPFALPLV